MRLSVAICLAAAMSAVVIPSSRGGGVRGQDVPPVFTFHEHQDEANHLVVQLAGIGQLIFRDSVALAAGEGCVSLSESFARCTAYDGHGGGNANINLGDNDDSASVIVGNQTANVFAGKGQDTVFADAFGGRTKVYGEEGNDSITAAGEGGQIADGGPGNDFVTARMPCGTGGGATGLGGPGDDIVRFSDCGNHWTATTLEGGSGADLIEADPTDSRDSSTAAGGDGNDIIRIGTGQNQRGPFTITGGSGDDTLRAGDGDDTVAGADGNDYLDVQGGGADVVTCGPGWDIALHDASDTVSDDCEIRSKDGHLAWFPPTPFSARLGQPRTGPVPAAPRSGTRATRSG